MLTFQYKHASCKFVVKRHIVRWGQLAHIGDTVSEAHIIQIPQIVENCLYQGIVIHDMLTLILTHSLFITYDIGWQYARLTQGYEIELHVLVLTCIIIYNDRCPSLLNSVTIHLDIEEVSFPYNSLGQMRMVSAVFREVTEGISSPSDRNGTQAIW